MERTYFYCAMAQVGLGQMQYTSGVLATTLDAKKDFVKITLEIAKILPDGMGFKSWVLLAFNRIT